MNEKYEKKFRKDVDSSMKI